MKTLKLFFALMLAWVASLQCAIAQDLSLGVLPELSAQASRAVWEPFIADMNKKTGLNVSLYLSNDYAGIIDAMRDNKVQIAVLGNKSAMEAVDKSSGVVFAQLVAADGNLGYYSYLIAHKSSKLNSVADVLRDSKALNYGNGDLNSTSGYLVPQYYIFAKNNVDSKTAFRSSRNASHENNFLAAANRQVDVAAISSSEFVKIGDTFPDKLRELKVIWTSPLIPLDPVVMRKDLAPGVADKLKAFFLSYGVSDEREKQVLQKLYKIKGFKESTDRQLIPVRQIDLYSRRLKVQANESLSESDQRAALAEIDKKLKALE